MNQCSSNPYSSRVNCTQNLPAESFVLSELTQSRSIHRLQEVPEAPGTVLKVLCVCADMSLSRAQFFSLGHIDIWGQGILCCGSALCIVRRRALSQASTHEMPVARPQS